eukprot:CAMPEP_0198540520 /NCGR_PEP_ID=MMETSP1462-20131121/53244_1 /TAXON_ID=1333877 /ORGANISM="Brandtodinium nutriculum, Strain RCC3387" /LENGTH=72 /DNA_ID=CAMNT_0044270631 /DNA_START=30 /DNA_END=246 /DNA_ORIENTATION=-
MIASSEPKWGLGRMATWAGAEARAARFRTALSPSLVITRSTRRDSAGAPQAHHHEVHGVRRAFSERGAEPRW